MTIFYLSVAAVIIGLGYWLLQAYSFVVAISLYKKGDWHKHRKWCLLMLQAAIGLPCLLYIAVMGTLFTFGVWIPLNSCIG